MTSILLFPYQLTSASLTLTLTFSLYIYAAGSVAKYPNHITGHTVVAGEGIVNGTTANKAAAENMARGIHASE